MIEEWLDLPDYEGLYQVSNLGRVKSLGRVDTMGRELPTRIMKPQLNSHGYYHVGLRKQGIKKTTFTIHKLVAMTFLDHRPSGMRIVIDHIDGDKLNNSTDNLQLISNRENLSKESRGSSKYTGVCWESGRKKWRAYITKDYIRINLGSFTCETEAAEAYQKALSCL